MHFLYSHLQLVMEHSNCPSYQVPHIQHTGAANTPRTATSTAITPYFRQSESNTSTPMSTPTWPTGSPGLCLVNLVSKVTVKGPFPGPGQFPGHGPGMIPGHGPPGQDTKAGLGFPHGRHGGIPPLSLPSPELQGQEGMAKWVINHLIINW